MKRAPAWPVGKLSEMRNMSLARKTITSILIIAMIVTTVFIGSGTVASAAGAVRNTDVTSATSGNTLIMYDGDFLYTAKDTILARLNAIRYEACAEGVYGLSLSDYVPLKWSSDLEWIAQTRAAEATLNFSHTRPNWSYYESLKRNGLYTENECLYYGGSVNIMRAIESWYSEKFDTGDTSHYRAIIDPSKRHVALGGFMPTSGWGAITAEFTSRSGLNEDQTGSSGRFTQILEVDSSKVSVTSLDAPDRVHIGIPKDCTVYGTVNFSGTKYVRLLGNFTYSSSNTNIATVTSAGKVTGVNAGTATIKVTVRGSSASDTVTVEGHNWSVENVDKEPTCIEEGVGYLTCSVCGVRKAGSEYPIPTIDHPYGDWITRIPATCDTAGSRKKVCKICKDTVYEVVPALGHAWDRWEITKKATATETGTKTRVCKRDPSHTETKVIPARETNENTVSRIYGSNRYQTSLKVADQLKAELGVDKFDTVILAYGGNYADALAGSYLSCVKSAPIILVNGKTEIMTAVQDYIKANLNNGGSIYLLGGSAVVPDAVVSGLSGYNVTRLGGKNRYETNIAILKETSKFTEDNEIMITSGEDFADSLSVASLGRPILLVKNNLMDLQKNYLRLLGGGKTFYIIGGTGAVSDNIISQLGLFGTTERIGGHSRFETSVNVAKRFFDMTEDMVLAYGKNFPDGLCGGVLAYELGAPLILTAEGNADLAAAYRAEAEIPEGVVLGGAALISDASIDLIFYPERILASENGENNGDTEDQIIDDNAGTDAEEPAITDEPSNVVISGDETVLEEPAEPVEETAEEQPAEPVEQADDETDAGE